MLYMGSYTAGGLIDNVERNGEITASCEIYSERDGDFLGTATFNLGTDGEVALLGTTISAEDIKKYDIKLPEMEKMIENDIADTIDIRAELGDYFMRTLKDDRAMTMESAPESSFSIIRNGEEIGLTEDEIYGAYKAHFHEMCRSDVEAYIDSFGEHELDEAHIEGLTNIMEKAHEQWDCSNEYMESLIDTFDSALSTYDIDINDDASLKAYFGERPEAALDDVIDSADEIASNQTAKDNSVSMDDPEL